MKNIRSICATLMCVGIAAACSEDRNPDFAGSGVIEATEITVSAKTTGTLMALDIDEGTRIAEHDTIATVDVETIVLQRAVAAADIDDIDWNERILASEIESAREQVSQATLRRSLAEKTYNRILALNEQGAATDDKLDAALTERDMSDSALRVAKNRLDEIGIRRNALSAKRAKVAANLRLLDKTIADGTVIAPGDGEVVETYVEAGEMVMAGSPLCTIADLSEVTLRIYVSEYMLGKLVLGSEAAVEVDSHPGERFTGRISWISPVAEFTPKNVQTREARADLVYAVEITLANPDGIFKVGMPSDAYIAGIGQ